MLVVAGSSGMMGAGALVSKASLMAGAGLVTWALPDAFKNYAAASTLEVMRLPLSATNSYKRIVDTISKRKINVCAIGPGLSTAPKTAKLVRRLVLELKVPAVLDADGLNSFKGNLPDLKKHSSPLVLTPHKGEFERLFEVKWPEDGSKRAALAKKLSKIYDVTLVLKGSQSLVVQGLKVVRNQTGNASMAKGGSGDVLTGIIAAFLAQGLKPFEAARWGVHFHGLAGDLARQEKGELSVTASDLIEFLPKAFLR